MHFDGKQQEPLAKDHTCSNVKKHLKRPRRLHTKLPNHRAAEALHLFYSGSSFSTDWMARSRRGGLVHEVVQPVGNKRFAWPPAHQGRLGGVVVEIVLRHMDGQVRRHIRCTPGSGCRRRIRVAGDEDLPPSFGERRIHPRLGGRKGRGSAHRLDVLRASVVWREWGTKKTSSKPRNRMEPCTPPGGGRPRASRVAPLGNAVVVVQGGLGASRCGRCCAHRPWSTP